MLHSELKLGNSGRRLLRNPYPEADSRHFCTICRISQAMWKKAYPKPCDPTTKLLVRTCIFGADLIWIDKH
jgi:hypothetical protein